MPLIKQAMQEKAAAPAEEGREAPAEEGQETGGEAATPQEQDAYERVVMAGMKVLYDQSTHQGVMQMLAAGKDDPAKALADAVALIMTQVDQKSGGKVPQTVILPAAAEILGLTAELAEKAGLFKVDERIAGRAMQQLILKLGEEYGADPGEIQALMQGMDESQLQGMVQQQQGFAQEAQQQSAPQGAATPPQGV